MNLPPVLLIFGVLIWNCPKAIGQSERILNIRPRRHVPHTSLSQSGHLLNCKILTHTAYPSLPIYCMFFPQSKNSLHVRPISLTNETSRNQGGQCSPDFEAVKLPGFTTFILPKKGAGREHPTSVESRSGHPRCVLRSHKTLAIAQSVCLGPVDDGWFGDRPFHHFKHRSESLTDASC